MNIIFTNYFNNKKLFPIASFGVVILFIVLAFSGYSSKSPIKKNNTWSNAFAPPRIGDFVWHDQNGNGIQDAGEPGIQGVEVSLYDNTGTQVGVTITTAADGSYSFEDLSPGNYYVHFDATVVNPNYVATEPYGGTNGAAANEDSDVDDASGNGPGTTLTFTLAAGQDKTDIDAGFYIYATIGKYTWEDENANGIREATEGFVGGVNVTLDGFTGAGTPYSDATVSTAGGVYGFSNVPPGDYTINFDLLSSGMDAITYQDEGGDDNVDSDPDPATGDISVNGITSSQVIDNIDAGFYKFGTIGDYTWEDSNGNGIQDGGEPDLSGVDVKLTGTTGNGTGVGPISTTTGGAGDYQFTDIIPGNYTINFNLASSGYDAITLQDQGGDDDIDSDPDPATGDVPNIDIISGQDIENIDAGFYRFVTIGDFVWEDMNGDGIQDGGEPGIDHVSVTLVRNSDNMAIASTITDGVGIYSFAPPSFQIPPGDYYLNFATPAGYFIIDQDMTTDDLDSDPDPSTGNTINFTIASGETTDIWDAGMYRPASVGDYCWRDQDVNGIQNASEFPMPNVMVSLYLDDGTLIDQTFTDGAGMYLFDNNPDIKPGDYYVEFEIPATFLITLQNTGGECEDSDPDASGITPIFTLQSGTDTTCIDAGYYVEPPSDCTSPTAGSCEEAEVLCELQELNEFCTSMVSLWQQTPIPGCGSGYAFHNPSWFAFVAGATDISLIIHAAPCVAGIGNIGIQWGIYDDCDLNGPIVLQCPCVSPGDIPVNLTGLTIGQTYYFFIDGCSGTQCTYWLEILYGGGTPEVTGPLDVQCDSNFPDCENICVGSDVTFTLEDVNNAVTYIWDVNGVIDSTSTPDTTIHFDVPGTYNICVYGKNDCNTGDPFCFDFEVEHLPPEDLGSFDVCENILENGYTPDDWQGPPLTSEGQDSILLSSPEGCDYWQKVEIIKLPRDTVYIDTTACAGDDIIIEGVVYTYDVVNDEITVEGGAANGCDKQIFVTTHFITLDGYLEVECSGFGNNSVKIIFHVDELLPLNPQNVKVTWYKDGAEFDVQTGVQGQYDITVYEDGIYSISIDITYDNVTCTFEDFPAEDIFIDDFMPDAPQTLNWPLVVCSNSEDWLYYEITNADPNNDFIWSWPGDAVGVVSADQLTLQVFWQGSAGGDICVNAYDPNCGNSDTICQTVTVIPAPNSPFTIQDTICLSSVDTITYIGIASDTAEYTWNFSGGTDDSPLGPDSQGPHYISWNSPGPKVISLIVNEGGCESEMTVDTIMVQTPPQMPSISCSSTATSVSFEWESIVGASNTIVEVVSGSSGVLINDTTYTVTGMNPNDSVTIVLHIKTDGYCPDFSTEPITCIALDCPIVDVLAMPGDTSICLDGTQQPFNLTYSISPNEGGVISWSGNGIIDTLTGLFDPDSAGIGNHTVVLHYLNNECPYNAKAYIHIYEQPTADFSISEDTICITDQITINYTGNAAISGNPTWNFDGGTVVSGSGLNQHIVQWNSSGLKTITLEVENNNCISSPVSTQVYIQDTLDNIYISCDPSTDSIIFHWNLDPKVDAYKIFINGSQVDSAYVDTYIVNGLIPGDSVNISLIAIDKGICGDISVSDYCTAVECPKYKIDIQPNVDSICLDETTPPINFVATITNSDGTGTIEWSGNGIDPATGVFDPKVAGPGTHTIFMRFREVCSDDTMFTIKVIEKPVASFSVETSMICISDSVIVTFDNVNPVGTIYDWDLAGGTRTDISSDKFYIKWNAPGSYMLSLKTNNSICEADRIFAPVEVQPELIAPTINCEPTTNSILITWDKIDCASSYNVFVDSDMILNTTDTQYNLLDLEPNSTISFTVEAVSECACGNVSNTITCGTEPCPDISIEITGLPENLCISELNTISLDLNITGDNSGTIMWDGFGIDNSGNINLSGFNPGQYVYTAKYNVQKCDYSISDTLNIIPLPYYEVSSINPLCHEDENGGIIVTNNENYKYYLDGIEMENSSIGNLSAGTYQLKVIDQFGCESGETITLTDPDAIEPKITGPDFINENSSGEFQLANVDNFVIESINWYYEGGDTICSGTQCRTISISIDHDVNICVDIVNDNGCSATDCIEVKFIENVDVDIPNIFTPDGDGINDRFYIKGDDTVLSIKEMKIYDRWGELVFSKNNFPPNDANYGWDGNYKGKKVLPGVYVFYAILEIKDRPDMKFMGDITIVK